MHGPDRLWQHQSQTVHSHSRDAVRYASVQSITFHPKENLLSNERWPSLISVGHVFFFFSSFFSSIVEGDQEGISEAEPRISWLIPRKINCNFHTPPKKKKKRKKKVCLRNWMAIEPSRRWSTKILSRACRGDSCFIILCSGVLCLRSRSCGRSRLAGAVSLASLQCSSTVACLFTVEDV